MPLNSRLAWLDDEPASFDSGCTMLALASATNLGFASCLFDDSFFAIEMYNAIKTLTEMTTRNPLNNVIE